MKKSKDVVAFSFPDALAELMLSNVRRDATAIVHHYVAQDAAGRAAVRSIAKKTGASEAEVAREFAVRWAAMIEIVVAHAEEELPARLTEAIGVLVELLPVLLTHEGLDQAVEALHTAGARSYTESLRKHFRKHSKIAVDIAADRLLGPIQRKASTREPDEVTPDELREFARRTDAGLPFWTDVCALRRKSPRGWRDMARKLPSYEAMAADERKVADSIIGRLVTGAILPPHDEKKRLARRMAFDVMLAANKLRNVPEGDTKLSVMYRQGSNLQSR